MKMVGIKSKSSVNIFLPDVVFPDPNKKLLLNKQYRLDKVA